MKTKFLLFISCGLFSLSLNAQNVFTLDIQYGENTEINPLVYGNHFSRLFDRCRCYDPWSPEAAVDSIDQCMEYIASIQSKVIRFPSGGDNKWMHTANDSVGYGMLQSDVDTMLALAIIDSGVWATQSAQVAEQYELNPDGARYIDRLIDLVQYCEEVNDFAPKVIFVANITMSKLLPGIYNVWEENLEAIRYLIDNGVDVVGIEMGNEHYDDHFFEEFIDYWQHIRPLLDSLDDDAFLDPIPVSLTAAPEPDFAQLFGWSEGSVNRFKEWNSGLALKSGSPKFDAYSVHIYNTWQMMEPCYQMYTDDYYDTDPDEPIVFDPDLGPDPYITDSWQCALDSFENFAEIWLPYIFNHYTIIDDSTYRLGTLKRYWVTEWGVKPASEDRGPMDSLHGNFNNTFAEAAFTMEYLLKLLEIQGAGSQPIDIEFATKHNTMSGFTYGLLSHKGRLDPDADWFYKRASYYPFVINENIFSPSYERVNCSPVLLDGSYLPYVRGYFNEGSDLFYMCFVNGTDDTVKFAIHEMTGDTTVLGYGSLTPSSSYGCYVKHIRTSQLYAHGGMNQYMVDNTFYNDTTIAPLIDTIYNEYNSTFLPDSMVSLPPFSLGWVKWQVSPNPERLTAQSNNIQISTWPNPANDIVNFSIETIANNESNFTISVYNILGEKVTEIMLTDHNAEWYSANEAKGIYIYELIGAGKRLGTGKIILQ